MAHPAEKLIEFWKKCDLSGPPYCHPDDAEALQKVKGRVRRELPSSNADWMNFPREKKLEMGLLPAPYIGDIRNPKIVFCLMNPGLSDVDYYAESVPGFRNEVALQITQNEVAQKAFPFFPLNPDFVWSGSYSWWTRKLKNLIEQIESDKNVSRFEAARMISKRIAAIELFPYHSKDFVPRNVGDFASTKAIIAYAKSMADMGSTMIVMRRAHEWKLTTSDTTASYASNHARAASISVTGGGDVDEIGMGRAWKAIMGSLWR